MTSGAHILVVDDDPDLLRLLSMRLSGAGYRVSATASAEEALVKIAMERPQLVLSDVQLPGKDGLALFDAIRVQHPSLPVILLTAHGTIPDAVEATSRGVFTYLTKPFDGKALLDIIAKALAMEGASEAASDGGEVEAWRSEIVSRSNRMAEMLAEAKLVAASDASVLIRGESGSGKELVAQAIHHASPRANHPFVAVNCGAIPENLLESEFFGVRKGAFTGANADRDGFFQAANGGTLFLDEIGDLPFVMQSKLLRAIQERAVRAIGATIEQTLNVRIVSATHKDLAAEVQAGRFRQDLFYRLNVIDIKVPPLRDRLVDLPAIADALLARLAREAGVSPSPRLASDARALLARYAFPGNVRELENLLHRAVALSDGDTIRPHDLALPEALLADALVDPEAGAIVAVVIDHVPDDLAVAEATGAAGMARNDAAPAAAREPMPDDLVRYLDEVERTILVRALERQNFNRTAAGASLGLSLRQMRYRMARLGITEAGSSEP